MKIHVFIIILLFINLNVLFSKVTFCDYQGKVVFNTDFDDAGVFKEGLCLVKKDNKWGFIDKSGKIIINPLYDNVRNFSEEMASCNNGGKQVNSIYFIDGKWGFIDKEGKIVIEEKYSSVSDFKEGLAMVSTGGHYVRNNVFGFEYFTLEGAKYGFIDKSGNVVIEIKYDSAASFEFNDGITTVGLNKHYYCIDRTGKTLFESDSSFIFYQNLALYKKDKFKGYIDKTKTFVIPAIYDDAANFEGDYASVCVGNKWGLIDKTGKMVIEPFSNDSLSVSKSGLILFTENKKYGLMNLKKEVIFKPKYEKIPYISEDNFFEVYIDGKVGVVNDKEEYIIPLEYTNIVKDIKIYDGFIIITGKEKTDDFTEIDNYAKNTPEKYTKSVKELSNYLAKISDNETGKARAFYMWLVYHVTYDFNALYGFVYDSKGLNSDLFETSAILKTRKSVCGGYSRLFQELCIDSGIECEVVAGWVKNYSAFIGKDAYKVFASGPNHAWNAAKIDGKWELFDVTIGTTWGNYQDPAIKRNLFNQKMIDFFFKNSPERMIETHYAEDKKWLSLDNPITKKEFESTPNLYPGYFIYNMKFVYPTKYEISAKNNLTIKMQNCPEDKKVLALLYKGSIYQNSKEQNPTGIYYFTKSNDLWKCDVPLKLKGLNTVLITVIDPSDNYRSDITAIFLVNSQ